MGLVNYGDYKKTKGPNGTPSEYTDAQYKALDEITKGTERQFSLRVARGEFVNKVLLPDGTISDDTNAVLAAVEAAQKDDRNKFVAFQNANTQDILDDKLSPDLRAEYVDLKHWGNHDWLDELKKALAKMCFMLVVDANLTPRIYFQCDVPHNKDVEKYLVPASQPE